MKAKQATLYTLTFILALFIGVLTSCSNNDEVAEITVTRDYQTDSKVLAKFVDINKTVGEYYLNVNKTSFKDLLSDKDWQDLQSVNPLNKQRFEKEIAELNMRLQAAANNPKTSQMVYSTYNETWIRNLTQDRIVQVENTLKSSLTRARGSNLATLSIFPGSKSQCYFSSGKKIISRIQLNIFNGSYFFFDILCKTDAKKAPNPNMNEKLITLSGISMLPYNYFTWTAYSNDANINWQFEGQGYEPKNGGPIATATFESYN